MITVSAVLKEIIEEDEHILSVFRANMLNLSSFARSIHQEVEKRTLKKVKVKSLIVALSRLAKQYPAEALLHVHIQNLSIHSNLVDLSYEKTVVNQTRLSNLVTVLPSNAETFFTVIQGITEMTIIADKKCANLTKDIFAEVKPLSEIVDLVGITLKLDIAYLNVPQVLYILSRSLSLKKISIVEVISTATEITFIINKKDSQLAVSQLSKFLS